MASTEIVHAHAAPQGFIRKYIFSLDHKVIGLQYYFLALIAVFVGMALSLLMRIHMVWPTANLPIFGHIQPETYLMFLTMHGTIMVFFVLTTAPQSGFGNYFLPIQIGAPDMAFPTLNMLSFWTTFVAFVVLLAAFFVPVGLVFTGQTAVPPGGFSPSTTPIKHSGGSPLLWQHLFWFFGHPEVYIAILPGMGVASQLLSTFSRKPIFGYKAMVYAMLAIGLLGFVVWGHHMFMSGMSPYSAFAFSIMTMAIGVPSAIKTFNWLGTIRHGRVRFTAPMLFAIGFVSLFVSGGLSGPFLAQPVLDIPLHDTAFVVGHFHLIMGVAAIFGMFAGTYYWFPKMFGRLMNERWGRVHFFFTLIGTYCIFMPMHYLGMAGQPRRYSQFTELAYLHNLIPLNKFITYAAFVTIGAQLIFVINLFWSLKKGAKASDNPWEATTLEWTTATPPPHDNFGGRTPIVNHGPYEYSVPGAPRDYIMQTDPVTVSTH